MVEGFAEEFCRRPARHPFSKCLLRELKTEHHYYGAGRVLGLASFIILVSGMIVWIIGAVR